MWCSLIGTRVDVPSVRCPIEAVGERAVHKAGAYLFRPRMYVMSEPISWALSRSL
jgi:hypothetical protein